MGSKESSTKQESSPPKWATPLFEKSASEAMNLYQSGAGGRTYLGDTVAPLSDTTMQGVNQLAQAGQGWDTAGTRGLYQGIGAASVGPSSASENLAGYASGANLGGEGNPFYRERLEGELGDTAAQVRSLMSGMGRGGGGAETRELTDRLGRQRVSALEQDYNREQANQFNAVGMLDQQRNVGLDRALSTTGAMSGLDQQNFENRLAAAGATLQAGGLMDEQAQKQKADEVNKWYGVDNEDWTRLAMLQGAAAGAAGPYGTQLATSRQPVGLGGILSGVGSLIPGKSDVRLKENVILVGSMNGLPVYEFSYRGQPDRWRGTMAQAIPLNMSDAVVMEEDGFFAVDYGKLPFVMERA